MQINPPSSKASRKLIIFCLFTLACLSKATTGYCQLLRLMAKDRAVSLITSPVHVKLVNITKLVDATAAPTLDALVAPNNKGNTGTVIHLTGTNFDNNTHVFFGGIEASSIAVNSATDLDAMVGDGSSGVVIVQNKKGKAQRNGFTYLPPPTITSVSPTTLSPGTVVTIIGTSLANQNSVIFDGVTATDIVATATTITAKVAGPITKGITTVTTPDGIAIFPSLADQAKTQALADLSIPDPGQGFFVIPTPTFTYNQYHTTNYFGFSAKVWGNSLGTDSSKLRAGNKFLLPQTSMFGFKVEGDIRLTNRSDTNIAIAWVTEANLLLKKVSYFDVNSKVDTNFNPFVIHPRTGLLFSFFHDDIYVGAYCNVLCVVSENENFSKFFQTGTKNVFVYPEVTVGGIFDLDKGSKQALRLEIDMLINNGDASYLYGAKNPVIPNLKIGFITRL